MGPAVLLSGPGLFGVAFLVHVLWWRLKRPGDDLKVLALCLCAVPLLACIGLVFITALKPAELALALVMAWSAGIAYLFWYPAAQAASPTMLITILAHRAGSGGISESSLKEAIPEELLAGQSIHNLFAEKFAVEEPAGTIRLAPRGRRTLLLIKRVRRAAGLKEPRG